MLFLCLNFVPFRYALNVGGLERQVNQMSEQEEQRRIKVLELNLTPFDTDSAMKAADSKSSSEGSALDLKNAWRKQVSGWPATIVSKLEKLGADERDAMILTFSWKPELLASFAKMIV